MAMIYNPNADLSKGEPVIKFTSPPAITDEKPMRLGTYAMDHLNYLQEYHEAEYTQIFLFGNLIGVSAQHSSASGTQRGSTDGANGEKLGSNRGAETNRSIGVGRLDEQHQPVRKGDNLRRDNLHTVNSEEQVNTSDEKAEVKNQTSAF